jgi:hypothetical protein
MRYIARGKFVLSRAFFVCEKIAGDGETWLTLSIKIQI